MSMRPNEIDDNEIRIISANQPDRGRRGGLRRGRVVALIVAAVVAVVAVGLWLWLRMSASDYDESEVGVEVVAPATVEVVEPKVELKGYAVARDTVVNGRSLLILSPENARARLVVGMDMLNDSLIVLAAQAADVRRDNGEIAGTFVLNGELLSKGEAKAGFCSIIKGELTIGVADASPKLEQALTEGGYFFRQFPLVVGGQVVENKSKHRAVRKALAEIGGRVCVVVSRERLSFHEFSQLLIDVGVRNAIYLVGSSSYGFYAGEGGERVLIGDMPIKEAPNVSFIVWE